MQKQKSASVNLILITDKVNSELTYLLLTTVFNKVLLHEYHKRGN